MRIFYAIVLLIVLLSACKKRSFQQERDRAYHKSLLFFGDSLVQHFPKKLENAGYETTVLGATDTIKYFFKIHRIYLYQKYSDQEYPEMHARVDSLTKAVYDANDSTLLLVFDYQDKVEIKGRMYYNEASPLKKELVGRNMRTGKSLPVPLFGDEYNTGVAYTGTTYNGLRDGFKLHVLDARAGYFLPGNKLSDSSECLPEKWKHGFSRGIALNDQTKEAVCWIVVW